MIRVKLKFYGRVQGVGFRWFVESIARSMNLTGWVRNERDGTVLIIVEGEKSIIENFIERLKIGNGYSVVSKVELLESVEISSRSFKNFTIKFY